MSEQYNKLKRTLQTIFEMDKADLDFGIYRIMNQKRDEINRFLKEDLLSQVNSAFDRYKSSGQEDLQEDLEQKIQEATDLGAPDPQKAPAVLKIKEKIDAAVDTVALENEVYSHLHKFFSRYYDQGDFISKRRYKADTYAIPYEGEEVKLYWANHDQYYIKSSEHLRDYAFTIPTKDEDGKEKSVRIKLVEADTEKDNVKAKSGDERKFVLDKETPLSVVDGELLIHFHYVPEGKKKQTKLNEEAVATIEKQEGIDEWLTLLNQPAPTEKDKKRTLLSKHLNEYTARNTFDYFIHKDLGGFLRRELDFYIKNEVMFLDDIGNIGDDKAQEKKAFAITEQQIRKIKVIRTIAEKIIQMLAQLEDFQKKLWLKKKFVVETNYCITLDRVSEELYREIADCLEQHDEWVSLGFTTENTEITKDYLKENPYLVLDTKFFGDEFKAKLLASIDSFEDQLDGLLMHSENHNALRLIKKQFHEKVITTYIDPPFNLGKTPDYAYKVDYKDSSWLSLLAARLIESKTLIPTLGSIFVRCNHDGNMILRLLLEEVYGKDNYRNEIIVRRAEESKGDLNRQFGGVKSITVNYDNIYWFSKDSNTRFERFLKPTTDKQAKSHWHSFWKAEDRPNMRYVLLGVDLTKHYGQWMWKKERADKAVQNYKEYIEASNTSGESLDDYWRRTGEKLEFIKCDGDKVSSVKYWIRPRTHVMADNNWLDIKGYANKWSFKTENSEPLLKRVIESITKEGEVVLDYFAGSGTTPATAHKLGRKWIAVEMGGQFETVIQRRLKLVLNGEASGVSKDVKFSGGGFYKYMHLESYEDTLNNLMLRDLSKQQQDMLEDNDELREEYMLGYWMDLETAGSPSLLNIEQFEDPFNYTLNIGTGSVGATKSTKVDLVETFNYLLGLTVKQIDTIRGFKMVVGANPKEESVAVIWRNSKEKSNEDLEAFLDKQSYNPRDTEYDHIYVNGDHTLEDPHSKVKMIEMEFKRLMFEVE